MIISAILPIRNRPAERVLRAGETLLQSIGKFEVELIVSDFGSENGDEIKSVADTLGSKYIRQESNYWNKPLCLNKAISQAKGEFVLCADIDILWHPAALGAGLEKVLSRDNFRQVLAFQSRDLPEEFTDGILDGSSALDWSLFENRSELHSRWGNGILMFPKSSWEQVSGYDERLGVYGVEDLDFCRRLQYAGHTFLWSDPTVSRIYHLWHPKLQTSISQHVFARALERNRGIWANDHSVVRNARGGSFGDVPLISVVIATSGRSGLLRESIASVLCQTVQSFELIVVDDGQIDDTELVVESFGDSRIKYLGVPESKGISYARNLGGREARGQFIAVMDDDDICLPTRFEDSLASMGGGVDGCVGGFITFHDESGEVLSWDDPLPTLKGAFAVGGFAGHPTWMVKREVFEAFPYDESFTSSVDNNVAMRMLNSGVNLVHTGKPHVLRRVHSGQVSNKDSQFQGFGSSLDRSWVWAGYGREAWKQNVEASKKSVPQNRARLFEDQFLPYLPDSLMDRQVDAHVWSPEQRDVVVGIGFENAVELRTVSGDLIYAKYRLKGSWGNMAALSKAGINFVIAVFEPTERLTHRNYVAQRTKFAQTVPWRDVLQKNKESEFVLNCFQPMNKTWKTENVKTAINGNFRISLDSSSYAVLIANKELTDES